MIPAPDARSLLPTVPDVLAELVSRCLEKDPVLRASALLIGRDLSALADKLHVAPLEALTRGGPLGHPHPADAATVVEVHRTL